MVDLRPAHLDYGQRHTRHIGLLQSHAVRGRMQGVAQEGLSKVTYPRQVVRPDRGPHRLGFRMGAGAVRMLLFFLVAGTAGVLVAGLLLPVVGTVGLGARAAADSFDNLPEALRQPV